MIKVFTLNKNGKIELKEDELKKLLDESYWDGYRNGSHTTYTYHSPSWSPYTWTAGTTYTNASTGNVTDHTVCCSNSVLNTITVASNKTEEVETSGGTKV